MARFACRKGYFPLHKGNKKNKNETDKEESAENDDAISMNSESLDEEMSDSEEEEEEKQQVVRLRDLKDCKMEASTGMNCPTKALRKKKYSRAVKNNRKFREEINTNIVSESFDVILEEAQLAAGEPVFCQNCKSVFNKYSKLEDKCGNEEEKEVQVEESLQRKPPSQEEEEIDQNQDPLDEQTWICEFCYQKNKVMIEKEEIPTNEYVHYVLGMDEDKMRKDNDTNSVIFCLDVSGSMCVTTPVEGKLKIKGDKLKELQELMKFSDGSDQFYHGKRNHTYISRLQ